MHEDVALNSRVLFKLIYSLCGRLMAYTRRKLRRRAKFCHSIPSLDGLRLRHRRQIKTRLSTPRFSPHIDTACHVVSMRAC